MSLARLMKPGHKVKLADLDPGERDGFEGREDPRYQAELQAALERLVELQEKLYAEQKQSLLVILQALDTAGKDGVLRKVAGPLDSRGVHVASFKAPNSDELAHDYLWRVHQKTPRRGDITFFNRSHYEDVLVVRVLDLVPKEVWKRRYDHINDFERMLADEGTRVVKFYLHISRAEQKRRLQERIDDPKKNWKFEIADLKMRAHWDEFLDAYDDALERTSSERAPWYVIPADHKWARDLGVARVLVETLEDMHPQFPKVSVDSGIVIPD